MSDQESLFATEPPLKSWQQPGAVAGAKAREDALRRVEAAADRQWLSDAHGVVRTLAAIGEDFTTDDVWSCLEALEAVTHEPRALGAVMRWGVRSGLIRSTGRYVKSIRPECHRRPIQVWESGLE